MTWDEDIDARGLRCPLPVLKAQRRLREMAPGRILRLLADDRMAVIDVPHFCREAGHELLDSQAGEDGRAFLIRRGAAAAFGSDPP